MSLINFKEPVTFASAIEAYAVILQFCLTRLRDEVRFRDDGDYGDLYASYFLLSMTQDAVKEFETLVTQFEERMSSIESGKV